MRAYTSQTYQFIQKTSDSSARVIIPLIMDYLRPDSVIDFGCGNGDWLAVFKENGSRRVLGLDGQWVDKKLLAISADEFVACNLKEAFEVKDRFDLAVCLEVIGHLGKEHEDILLDSITFSAPVVLFSAPIPGQNGIGDDATNCEWPAYWTQKFAQRGFVSIDCLRKKTWTNQGVAFWFAQNIFIAVQKDLLEKFPTLLEEHALSGPGILPLVHPEIFLNARAASQSSEMSVRRLMHELPGAFRRALQRRFSPGDR